MLGGFVGKAAGVVASGLVGAAAYDGVKRLVRSDTLHGAAVTVTSWGLRGDRGHRQRGAGAGRRADSAARRARPRPRALISCR
jgi:hypothetical protein